MGDAPLILQLVQTLASLAVPFALVWAGHTLQKRAKFAEAVTAEKVKHYATISPHLNLIFCYRYRVGDFLDRAPESVLEAKRRADQQFWTFDYLSSHEFEAAYHAFMGHSFKVFGPEGTKALIRADGAVHPVKPTLPGWAGFTGEPVDRQELQRLYVALKEAIARDLGFRR